MDNEVQIEVVYALPERQYLIALAVPVGTSAREAVRRSNLAQSIAQCVDDCALGVFGRRLQNPDDYLVQQGDRIELYRPLLLDPKEIRKQRAARNPIAKRSSGASRVVSES